MSDYCFYLDLQQQRATVVSFPISQHSACKRAFDETEGNMEKGENEWAVQGGRAAGPWRQIRGHGEERRIAPR